MAFSEYLPDLIKGDLDSLRDDVKDYYASKVCGLSLRPLTCHTPDEEDLTIDRMSQ